MNKLANVKVRLIVLSLISSIFVGCASSNVPRKPVQPKGKWYVINQEQIDLVEAQKAEKTNKAK